MEYEDACNTGLSLDLGLSSYGSSKEKHKVNKPVEYCLGMSTKLLPKEEAIDLPENGFPSKTSSSSVHHHYNPDHIGNNKNGCTKKLRLTREQSALLEDSFQLHSSLNTFQKQSLAEKLNLRPRQVEVWFQNRRARTKLKQTEIDCELLRKWCEKLSDENRRLKRELQELRAIKVGASSLHIQLSKAAAATATATAMREA